MYIELLNPESRSFQKQCQVSGKTLHGVDAISKTLTIILSTSGRITIPRPPQQSMNLTYPFICLQAFLPTGTLFSMEVFLTDSKGYRRRITFNQGKEVFIDRNYAKIPNTILRRDRWVTICFDMSTFTRACFPFTFNCIDKICIIGNCKVRRCFAMMQPLESDQIQGVALPAPFVIPTKVGNVTQTIIPGLYNLYAPAPVLHSTSPQARIKHQPSYSSKLFSPNTRLAPLHKDPSQKNYSVFIDKFKQAKLLMNSHPGSEEETMTNKSGATVIQRRNKFILESNPFKREFARTLEQATQPRPFSPPLVGMEAIEEGGEPRHS